MQDHKAVQLNDDQRAVVSTKLRDMSMGSQMLFNMLKDNEDVPAEMVRSVLSVTEHCVANIGALLDIPTMSAKEIEERHGEMRRLNMRIRELEGQIGQSQPPAMVRLSLGVLSRYLQHWWNLEGFGHISEEKYDRYGADVSFSCSLFGSFALINSATPVSDKELKKIWLDTLRDRGFDLSKDDGEIELIDNDNNRRVLIELFAKRIPSAAIFSFENFRSGKGSRFKLRGFKVRIRDMEDITQLPEPPPEE